MWHGRWHALYHPALAFWLYYFEHLFIAPFGDLHIALPIQDDKGVDGLCEADPCLIMGTARALCDGALVFARIARLHDGHQPIDLVICRRPFLLHGQSWKYGE